MKRGLAVVVVVGEGAPRPRGPPGPHLHAARRVGIPVEMISQGASRVDLSFVVAEEDADRAVRLLHRGLGLDLEAAAKPAPTIAAS